MIKYKKQKIRIKNQIYIKGKYQIKVFMKKISTKSTLFILSFSILIYFINSQDYVDPIPVTPIDKPTIIQANRYYSSKQKSVNYNIVSLNKTLPVVIIPKNNKTARNAYSNKVTLTLNDNQGNYISCTLEDNYQLCVLQKFNSEALSMVLQCESVPCQFSWTVLQAPIQLINTTNIQRTSMKQLYAVQQSQKNKHLTIKISCDSPQLSSQFHNQLQFYANRQNYHVIKTQGITYYLFSNPPTSFKQYFYLKVDQKFRKCAQIKIYNQLEDLAIGTQVTDFVRGNSSLTYNIKNHTQDMRLDAQLHLFTPNKQLQGQFKIRIDGTIGGVSQTIRKMSINPKKNRQIQLSFIINNIVSHYSQIKLIFESTVVDCILKFELVSGEIQQIQKGQYTFFSLKKGQKIKYKIIPQKSADSKQKVYIFNSDQSKVKLSKKQCESKTGCQFQAEAIQNFDGSFYIGQSKKQNTSEVVYFDIKDSFTKRMHEDTKVYLKKKVSAKKNYQVVVNTHNVILYAAGQQKCKEPSRKCHQKVGNSNHPFIFESEKDGYLLIAVHVLDESQFTVNIIEANGQYPLLKDGVPFSYLMDDSEEDVIFKFFLSQKQDLTFNLVSPFNQLVLYVFNGEQLPKKYNQKIQTYSSDGYIYFSKSQIKSKSFIVAVRKLNPSKTNYVHFTLIASTKNSNIKLQAGVTHHQKLVKNQHQDFVLQFDTSKNYLISFYIHNSIGQKVNVSLFLSKNDSYSSKQEFSSFTIDRLVDQIDISKQSAKICTNQELKSCQIFLRIQNKMDKDIGMQITLLTTNSIVQLHDGVWQYFPQQLTSTTTHFYFFAKHSNNPLTILYESNNPDLRILYSLIKMSEQDINPQDWNFPTLQNKKNQKSLSQLGVRQVNHITIDKGVLKTCIPDCLLLITLVKAELVKGQFNQIQRDKQFGILISNNIIDVPQKTKVDVTLQKGEQKYLKFNLKSVIQRDTLTSYVYTSLGSVSIFANVCSQKNLRMPSKDQYDFSFGLLQTQLRTQTIKKKIDQNQIQQAENPYLCLVAVTQQNSKFSIEYTSQQQIISLLRLDQFKTVNLSKNNPKYFQVEASVEHTIKIVRNKGFPFIEQKKCTGKDISYQECLQDLQEGDQDKKFQLVQKIKRYQYEPCQKCIVYLKISSEQPAEVDIHLESKYTEITLQQKKIVTDYLQKNQQNRYQITAISNEPAYINLNVINGNIKCKITDMGGINIQKQSNSKDRVLHFAINPNQLKQKKDSLLKNPFETLLSGFGLQHIFTSLHVSVVSTDLQKGASYTIQYSSGERQSYLQDGIVYKYNLQSNNQKKSAKFYYENFYQNNHVYIFLSSKKSAQLSKLDINIYQMDNIQDEDGKKLINSKIPQLRKKTVKPTVLYSLPVAKFYSIQVANPTGSQVQFSIGVNHQQIIFLPYQIDYPFPLANGQNLNLILDVQNKGYILLTFKKCDQSTIELSYTFDYEGFKKGQFEYTTSISSNQPKFQQMIKTKQLGPLYINVKRNQPEGIIDELQFKNSVFSISSRFSQTKLKTNDYMKPGNKGVMTYEVLSDDKIKVQFYEVTCQSKSQFCSRKFDYFLVTSDKMVDVYSQSVCPSTYFAQVQNSEKHPVLPLRKILERADSNHKITVEYQFEKAYPISYIAVKAVYRNKEQESIEVYYQPIQVATLWGQLQKVTHRHGSKIGIIFGGLCLFCLFIVCLRRQRRKGYQTIQSNE